MSEVTSIAKRPSILGGAMIIAGTAVGAGMFSIPIGGLPVCGFLPALSFLLIYTWFCLFMSGLMILKLIFTTP